MHRWKVGDEVFARYYDMASDQYVARHYGRVTAVGAKGFTVQLTKPDHQGRLVDHIPHDAAYWPTQAEAEAHIAAHPFNSGLATKG